MSRLAVVTLLLAIAAGPLGAQVQVRSQAAEIRLTGRVQTQFNTTSVTGEPGSEFLIRRARFAAELTINQLVSGKIEPDYGEGTVGLRDVYLRLTFSPALRATFGQFKRPFDLFQLTSSTDILVIERTGKIRGVGACSGPGGVCSLSQLTEKLQFSDRDIGAMLDGVHHSGKVGYMVAITNGAGQNVADENGGKSFAGRLRATPSENLAIAVNLGLHDYVHPTRGDERAAAWGADLEAGSFEEGMHVQLGVVGGENWRNLVAGDPSTFLAAQAIVTYKVPLASTRYVTHVDPVGRLSWGDPNTAIGNDDGVLLTPGVVLHFAPRNKLAVNLDFWSPAQGPSEWSLKMQSYLYF